MLRMRTFGKKNRKDDVSIIKLQTSKYFENFNFKFENYKKKIIKIISHMY